MRKPSRRRFLLGSAVTITAVSGCVSTDDDSEPQPSDDSPADDEPESTDTDPEEPEVPDDIAAMYEHLPAESAVEMEYQLFMFADLDEFESRKELGVEGDIIDAFDDIEFEEANYLTLIRSSGYGSVIGALSGDFDRPEPGTEVGSEGDWRLAEGDQYAFASDDGIAVFAADQSGPQSDTAEVAVDADVESLGASADGVPEAFGRLEDSGFVVFTPDVDGTIFSGISPEKLRAMAAGFETYPGQQDGTVENEYLLYPANGATIDDDDVSDLLPVIEQGEVLETEIERDDAVYVEAVVEQPLRRDPDAAPDAEIRSSFDPDEGTVEIEHRAGDTIDADELELWIDGERAARQPADRHDEFAAGNTIETDAEPLTAVALRWVDEEESVQYVYVQLIVGEDDFTASYDYDATAVEVTYRGDREADPTKLAVRRERSDGTRPTKQVDTSQETLTAGDTIIIEDVELEESIALRPDIPNEPRGAYWTVLHFRASPPRVHFRQREEGVTVTYHGDHDLQASQIRLLVDDEPTATQFEDAYETLGGRDSVTLESVQTGSEVVAEWVEPDEPIEVGSLLVTPQSHLESSYAADGTVSIKHAQGEAIDADNLELRVEGEAADEQFVDDHDTFAEGDTFSTVVEPFVVVSVEWVGAEKSTDSTEDDTGEDSASDGVERSIRAGSQTQLVQFVTGQEFIDVGYDPDAGEVELVYVGEPQADPDRLVVQRRGDAAPGGETTIFSERYDTLTQGDSVVLDDVATDERMQVVLSNDAAAHRAIVHFTAEPRYSFRFDERDGEVVMTYYGETDRDADQFRVLADGELTDIQPDDEYDTVSMEDELELGEFASGAELVVEWTVPDEPVEVDDHVVLPDAAFAADYDPEAGTVTVTHTGGDAIDATDLGIAVQPVTDGLVDWVGADTVTEGDATMIAAPEQPRAVYVVYREGGVLEEIEFSGEP